MLKAKLGARGQRALLRATVASAAILTLTHSPLAWAGDSEVIQLKYASSFYWAGAGSSGRAVKFEVRVKNLGPEKAVFVHYRRGDGNWVDLPLAFASHHGDYDLFTYTNSRFESSGELPFAIKYEVNGDTHWSNNYGANYLLHATDHVIIDEDVVLRHAGIGTNECLNWMGCYQSSVSGEIYVRNTGYRKHVGLRYSVDGGRTWQEAPARYASTLSSSGGVEIWNFSFHKYTPFRDGRPELRFAVFYENLDDGKWDWDNNFGRDFKIKDPGAPRAE